MSYEEWRAWNPEGIRSEWVDGEAIIFMSTSIRHARLVRFLLALLDHFVCFRGLGEVFAETVEMHLGGRSRFPDILFVRTNHLHRVSETRLDGPADLVIEIVSDDSVDRDRKEKFAEYAAAGVAEYWLIEARPGEIGAEFYRLVNSTYEPIPLDADGRLRSTVVEGFWLRPEWLWTEPLPNAWSLAALLAPDNARAALATLGLDNEADHETR
jgi:Uma2 family endonuclease